MTDSTQVNNDTEHSLTISSRERVNSNVKQVYSRRVDIFQPIYLIFHVDI
jgi:hypothetical protein